MRGESKYHYVDLTLIDDLYEVCGREHGVNVVRATDSSLAKR